MNLIFLFGIILAILPIQADLPVPEIHVRWPVAHKEIYLEVSRFLTFKCLSDGVSCPPGETQLDIFDEITQNVMHSEPCNNRTYVAPDFIPGAITLRYVNNTWLSAKLRCRLRGEHGEATVSENSVTIPFLNCMDTSTECIEEANCGATQDELKFCVITKYGPDYCSTLRDERKCQDELSWSSHFCPINVSGFCKASGMNYSAMWFWASTCPVGVTELPLSYKGRHLMYEEVIMADPSEPALRLKCPANGPLYNTTVEFRTPNGLERLETRCKGEVLINLTKFDSQFFNRSLSVKEAKFILYSDEWRTDERAFSVKVVAFDRSLANLEIKSDNYFVDDKKYLFCRFKISWEFYETAILPVFWWTKRSTGDQQLDKQMQRNRFSAMLAHKHMTNGSDEYQCHAIFKYKTCSPYRKFDLHQGVISSERFTYNHAASRSG